MQRIEVLKNIAFVIILFSIATAFRLPGISFHSLWSDETSTASIIEQKNVKDIYKALYTFEGTPPFFYLLEKCFIDIFDLQLDEFSLRFIPLLFGVFSCILYYFLFRRISEKRTAFLAFLLIAASNFHVYLSEESRAYTLFGFFALLTLFLTIQWFDKPNLKNSVLLSISSILMIQAHYYGVLWAISLWLAVFIITPQKKLIKKFTVLYSFSALFSFLLLTPLFLCQIQHETGQVVSYLTSKWIPGIFYSPIKVLIGAYLFKRNAISDLTVFDWTGVIISGVICATAIYLLIQRFRNNQMSAAEKIIIVSSITAFLIHVSLGSKIPTVHPRYMAYFLVLVFGIIISSTSGNKNLQILIFIILISINAIGFYRFYDRAQNYIEPWREIAQIVNNCVHNMDSERLPVVADNSTAYPVAFYLKNSSPLYTIPLFTKPDQENTYSILHFFGHPFHISLFHYTYYPVMGQVSLSDVFSEYRKGIALYKGKCYELIRDDLMTTYGSIVRFDMIQEFHTNQGTVIILQWNTIM